VTVSRRDKPTALGKALRQRDASLRSGWEADYRGAAEAALAGDVARLLDLLRAHRVPTEGDLDAIADYVETTAKRSRGRERAEAVHEAVGLAEALMDTRRNKHGRVPKAVRDRAIEDACELKRREGAPVDPERVRDLLARPRARRR
jgi:hypothetical protein